MKYCILEIAYDDSFHGFQKQPEIRTVQGVILDKLKPLGITKIYGSSRTDAGVRSSSTIIELQYEDCYKICKIIDSINGIYVLSYAESDHFIKLRGNQTKVYVYVYPKPLEEETLKHVINELISSTLSNFSRSPDKKVILDSLDFRIGLNQTLLIFRGKSFSWNFVRIASETIIKRVEKAINDSEWNDLLNGRRRYRFKGKASNLILIKTKINLPMKKWNSSKNDYLYNKYLVLNYWLKGIGIEMNLLDFS